MEPIHFKGLNCYHDCVITIVNHYNISYTEAFSSLWSETDFRYDLPHGEYMPMRLISDLLPLGIKICDHYWSNQHEKEADFALLQENEPFLIGMDAYLTPWNPSYMKFHGPHYYVAKSVCGGVVQCCDPTYNIKEVQIAFSDIIENAYTLTRAIRVASKRIELDVFDEPRRILDEHAATLEAFIRRINCLASEQAETIVLFAKYIDAIINNRHLYRRYIETSASSPSAICAFMNSEFFKRWNAVKFGIYKASMVGDREAILGETNRIITNLFSDEMRCAEKILKKA